MVQSTPKSFKQMSFSGPVVARCLNSGKALVAND
jgi:hypothetical protein